MSDSRLPAGTMSKDKMIARSNNENYEKKHKLTLRYDDGIESMINTITKRDGISKSDCVRRGIMSLYEPNKSDVLPQLCNLCSVVNKLMEEADMDRIAKASLGKELNDIWQQL